MSSNKSDSRVIPTKNGSLDNPSNYSSTPGGTLFSTTPGGTRIVYDKNVLMNLRNSPISKTPPQFSIPEALQRGYKNSPQKNNKQNSPKKSNPTKKTNEDSPQFDIEL